MSTGTEVLPGRGTARFDVRAALRAMFTPAERLLLVGVRGFGQPGACAVSGPAELPQDMEPFDAAVWLLRVAPIGGLGPLRKRVRPAGRIVLWVEPAGLAAQVWSAVSGAPARACMSLEQACEALVRAGLLTPSVLAAGARGFAVCGTLPAQPDALDAFFEQPWP